MGTESLPPTPELEIVADVIGLADACEAERHAQRPAEDPMYRDDDFDHSLPPRPRRDALVSHLLSLETETVAALYAIFRCGDYPSPTASEAMDRYRGHFEIAMEPMHREHGATDLESKGQLADGLRRGLEYHDLATDRTLPRSGHNLHPATYLED